VSHAWQEAERRDHKFSAGYPSFEEKGAVSWAGNIRPVSPETNCNLDKSDPVVRDRYQESRRAIRIGGPPGSLDAVCALGPGTRPGQRRNGVGRWIPAGSIMVPDLTVRDG
jgi:hypothetical protein